jgi:hypothetical protein
MRLNEIIRNDSSRSASNFLTSKYDLTVTYSTEYILANGSVAVFQPAIDRKTELRLKSLSKSKFYEANNIPFSFEI